MSTDNTLLFCHYLISMEDYNHKSCVVRNKSLSSAVLRVCMKYIIWNEGERGQARINVIRFRLSKVHEAKFWHTIKTLVK